MPMYEYQCKECGHTQDELHGMSGPEYDIICEKCGSKEMSREITAPYAKFVGEGWDTNTQRNIQQG